MGRVLCDITMSLDGYIAGPNDGPGNPLGDGGGRIHEWMYKLQSWRELHGAAGGETNRDNEVIEEASINIGATVMGRRMFNNGEEPWGPNPPFHMPVFVITHHARETLTREGGTTFTFVTSGPISALEQARAVAGDKDVKVAGGGNIITQYLNAGLIDEIQIHLAPVFLGTGVRLFEQMDTNLKLEIASVITSPEVSHLKYRLVR